MPRWTATTKRVLAGCAAIAAGIRAFADDATLSWADQVIVVADDPAERQLAAAAAAILDVNQRPTMLRESDEREAIGAGWVAIVSDDADDAVRAAAQELAGT